MPRKRWIYPAFARHLPSIYQPFTRDLSMAGPSAYQSVRSQVETTIGMDFQTKTVQLLNGSGSARDERLRNTSQPLLFHLFFLCFICVVYLFLYLFIYLSIYCLHIMYAETDR